MIVSYKLKVLLYPLIPTIAGLLFSQSSNSQLQWQNVDSLYQPLPPSVHIYFTDSRIDTGSFRAYYVVADLKDRDIEFTTDTSKNRRLTPSRFYERNGNPLLVVNGTFFSFETNRNLNAVIKGGNLVAYNVHDIPGRGKDTLTYRHPFGSAIGISRNREADIAWLFTDSSHRYAYASQAPVKLRMDSFSIRAYREVWKWKHTYVLHSRKKSDFKRIFEKWRMQTAIGGGPVLLQKGEIKISNEPELKFAGKAISDKHPRTAMGYTKDGKLIILAVEGRNKNAGGATLTQEAQIFKDLGCWEALNLDGGGSSCMIVNGKETIKVSDVTGQRPVPAVFIIKNRK